MEGWAKNIQRIWIFPCFGVFAKFSTAKDVNRNSKIEQNFFPFFLCLYCYVFSAVFVFLHNNSSKKKKREKFCPHRNWCLLKKSRVVFESLISLPFQLLAYNMTSMHAPIERRKLLSSNFKMLNFMSSLSTPLSTNRRAPAAAVRVKEKVQSESKSSGLHMEH